MVRSLLYEILEGNTSVGFLYGTIHIKNKQVFDFIDQVLKYCSHCNRLALEYDLAEADNQLLSSYQLPKGRSLVDYYGQKKYDKLRRSINKSYDVDLNNYMRLRPLFVLSALAETISDSVHQLPLDSFLHTTFKQKGAEIVGLETFQMQLDIADALSLDKQLKDLWKIGRNPSAYRKSLTRIIRLYLNQEVHKLYKLSKKGLANDKQVLLYNRNHFMVDRIGQLLDQHNPILIAVGTAHLAGEQGMIHLLKQQGYRIKTLAMKKPQ